MLGSFGNHLEIWIFFHLVDLSFSNLLFRQSLQDNKYFCLSTGGVVVIYALLGKMCEVICEEEIPRSNCIVSLCALFTIFYPGEFLRLFSSWHDYSVRVIGVSLIYSTVTL